MEGETNMKKEIIPKLLLSLVCAFVLVSGVFGAAVTTLSQDAGEETGLPTVNIAASEQEMRLGDAGEAPASALESATTSASTSTQVTAGDSEIGMPATQRIETDEVDQDINVVETTPESHGTRGAPVDFGGPYGEIPPGTPYFEGDNVPFQANMVGASNSDYRFRMDVNDDGIYDGPGAGPDGWGNFGQNDYTHTFGDNHVGVANVEAWDGVSMKTLSGGGNLWDEHYPGGWYMGGYYYGSVGMKFEVSRTITIDELGVCRYYYPYQYYNIRLWDAGQNLLTQVSNPYVPYYSWRWFSISPITIPAGEYVISVGIRGYYQYGDDNPGPSSDGIINPISWVRSSSQWSYPNQDMGNNPIPMLDVEYTYSYDVPDVSTDTADVFVDNIAPVVGGATAIGEPGQEGSSIDFTAYFWDIGRDDEWQYRWNFGDGTISPWFSVKKVSGGANVLFLHCLGPDVDTPVNALNGLNDGFITNIDTHDYGPTGANNVPDLATLLNYDVIVVGTNYYNANNAEVGDKLADFSDIKGAQGSGGVIIMAFGHYGADPGVQGRWVDDEYDPLDQSFSLSFGTASMGPVYLPGHPIMAGVSSLSAYYKIATYGVPRGDAIADYTNGIALAAAYENPTGSGARHAALNFLPGVQVPSGEWAEMLFNAIKWTSRQPMPTPLPMPIQLAPISHIYKDDHPTHVTSEDVFDVTVEVKDDDHERTFGGTEQIVVNECNLGAQDWAELWNHGGSDINLQGWTVRFYDNRQLMPDTYTFGNFILPAGGSVRIREYGGTDTSDTVFTGFNIWWVDYTPYGGGCLLTPTPASGYPMDIVRWNSGFSEPGAMWGPPDFNPSSSIYRHTDVDTDTGADWTAAGGSGTPNRPNPGQTGQLPPSTGAYVMDGMGEDATTARIMNALPGLLVPPSVVDVADENAILTFEGLEITDNAINEPTEEFWYRIVWDDGTPAGDWTYKGTIAPPPFKILLLHSWGTYNGEIYNGLESQLQSMGFADYLTIDEYNFGPTGTNTIPTLAYMMDYDAIVVSMDYYIFNTGMVNDLGNKLADYSDAGGGVVQMTFSAGTAYYSQVAGRWMNEDYNPIDYAPNHYGYVSLGDIITPHPIMEDVGDMEAYYKHSANGVTSGATLVAEYTTGFVLAALTDAGHHAPGGGKIVGLNYFPWWSYTSGDAALLLANALIWAWGQEIPTPVLPTMTHIYADNGIYNPDVQIIDDDMGWEWLIGGGSAQPVPAAGQTPTISHNIMQVEIFNTDPVITSKIRAYVELDLSLRMSGNKHNTATLRVLENGVNIGEVTVLRDPGSPDIGVLPVTLEMTKGFDYEVQVEYDPDDLSGANPTWIFETHWPDGKFKELKHTFNSNDPTDRVWSIPNIKSFMLGHDIIFEAEAADEGSDDLAFIYNWGDTTPQGVHIFANADPSVLDASTDEATVIFDQDPDRDPDFVRSANNIRSPDGGPIQVRDSISHVFDEGQPAYIFVMLTVLDDDCGDGYPSPYNNGGGYDMDFVELDFR
jgi:hypothetical protein